MKTKSELLSDISTYSILIRGARSVEERRTYKCRLNEIKRLIKENRYLK